MATVLSGFDFNGSIGELSFYKLSGTGKVVVRRKGGPSKQTVRKSKNFENTRRNNAEFGGRAKMSRWIMQSFWPLKAVADYNIAGPINSMISPVQRQEAGEWGKRPIRLSKSPETLSGFSLNRERIFETILRTPVEVTLSKESCSAELKLPAIKPGINFHPNNRYPFYSFEITLGVVPDLHLVRGVYQPVSSQWTAKFCSSVKTAWVPVNEATTESIHAISLEGMEQLTDFTLIVAIGIRFGTPSVKNEIDQVRHAGSAKVLKAI